MSHFNWFCPIETFLSWHLTAPSTFYLSGQIQQYVAEEEPRRKPILYEDLRLKNRENYEVTLTQKTETLMKPPPQRESERPKKNGKFPLD